MSNNNKGNGNTKTFNTNVSDNFNKMMGNTGKVNGNKSNGNNKANSNNNGKNTSHVSMSTILIIVLLLGFVVLLFSDKSKKPPPEGITNAIPITTSAPATRGDGRSSWFELREQNRKQLNERIVEEEYV